MATAPEDLRIEGFASQRLLGKGDMLFLGPASSSPHRIQGSWVTEDEVRAVAAHWRRQMGFTISKLDRDQPLDLFQR